MEREFNIKKREGRKGIKYMNGLKVNKIVKDIKKYLEDLERYLPIYEEILENDREKEYIISFLIEQIANECVNLGNHIISSLNLDMPESSKDIFDILSKNRYISKVIKEKIEDLVSVRNIIAHRYTKLSFEELVDVANEIEFVESFLDEILERIKNKK